MSDEKAHYGRGCPKLDLATFQTITEKFHQLGNLSEACRQFGITRRSYYQFSKKLSIPPAGVTKKIIPQSEFFSGDATEKLKIFLQKKFAEGTLRKTQEMIKTALMEMDIYGQLGI